MTSYPEYWSLSKLPFGRPESADDFYPGRPQREALARLDYLIRGGHSHALVIAPPGVGQTSLLRRAAASAGFGDCAVQMIYTGGRDRGREDLMGHLAIKLGVQRIGGPVSQLILERISAAGRSRIRTVWLIDDATPAAAMLAASLGDECPWLTAVLGCKPTNALKLAAGMGGCSLRVDLDAFELSDTVGFVKHQLVAAGGRPSIFTDSALVRLHELGQGRVAAIARLAELSLPTASGQNATHVHVDVVEAVQHEFIDAAA